MPVRILSSNVFPYADATMNKIRCNNIITTTANANSANPPAAFVCIPETGFLGIKNTRPLMIMIRTLISCSSLIIVPASGDLLQCLLQNYCDRNTATTLVCSVWKRRFHHEFFNLKRKDNTEARTFPRL